MSKFGGHVSLTSALEHASVNSLSKLIKHVEVGFEESLRMETQAKEVSRTRKICGVRTIL